MQAHVVDGQQPAELLAHLVHVEQAFAGGRPGALGQRLGAGPVAHALRRRPPAADEAPQPVGHDLQHHHQHDAEDDGLEVAAGAQQLGQQHLQLVFGQPHHGRAEEGAPHMAHAAQHRHEQVLDALVDGKGRGADAALEVREQPARDGRQHRGQHEGGELVAEGGDAHGLGHRGAALQRADRAAGARIQQVDHGQRGQQRDRPHQRVQPHRSRTPGRRMRMPPPRPGIGHRQFSASPQQMVASAGRPDMRVSRPLARNAVPRPPPADQRRQRRAVAAA